MATQELHRLSRADIDPLAASFAGELVLPGEAGYEERRSIWNRSGSGKPQQCTAARREFIARRAD